MPFVDLIARKRDGRPLSRADVDAFVQGVTDGTVPDYQTSALLMAIVLRGMTEEETVWLTDAMVRSGDRVDLSDLDGVTVGKHSTGGVGDKVSIVLAPLVAACGVLVPMMSGRGLGHTGGTLDKLESIPGYRVELGVDEFKRVLREVGTSIVGQTAALVPADRKLYALRDVTATVPSIPLIAASIMSKKLAEGGRALLLDVKCGDGAFLTEAAQAEALAGMIVAVGRCAGLHTEAVMTDMSVPLGRTVGNALEIVECIETLKGRGPAALVALVAELAVRMLLLSGLETEADAAMSRVTGALASGRALETLTTLIDRQGGDPRVVDDYSRLPTAPDRDVVTAPRAGFVTAMRAGSVGRAAHALGAGRRVLGEAIDHSVGIVVEVTRGDPVTAGQPVFTLHHRDGRGVDAARALCRGAMVVGDQPPAHAPQVLGTVC
jgi:pyrimidine-nucleoside phosphorylase